MIHSFEQHRSTTASDSPGRDHAGNSDHDLPTILAAWELATERLRSTHEALRGEVRRLTRELEAKNRQLARQNRLADIGQMASHVAHEVRNGLVPLTLYVSYLRRELSNQPAALSMLEKLAAGFTALEVTVNDLLQFTSDRQPQFQSFELRPLVVEVLDSVWPQLDAQGVQVATDIPDGLWVSADREMLRRALLNLVLNAAEVMRDGGSLEISGWSTGRSVEIEVADSGPGLTDDVRHHLFEPFFTTKSEGTGLGLTIVERIASAHGGSVDAFNCPQGGAAFVIRIPQRAMEAAA